MNVADIVPWAQIASTLLSALGVGVSIALGIASLNNNRRDRLLKTQPNLAFSVGGQLIRAELRPLDGFPGVNQTDPEVRDFLRLFPAGTRVIGLTGRFGQLLNYGQGTAYDVKIVFLPTSITKSGTEVSINAFRRQRPPYSADFNTILSTPSHIAPEQAGSFGILPGSVYLSDDQVSKISGSVDIECSDLNGKVMRWTQPTTFFVDVFGSGRLSVTVSFGRRSFSPKYLT